MAVILPSLLLAGGAAGPSLAAWNNCSHLPVLPFQPGLPDACLWPRGQPALQPSASLSLTSTAAFSPSWSTLSWGFGGLEVAVHLQNVWLFVTPWTAACQAPLSSTICWSLLKFMSTQLVILSNHVILCHPLLILSSHLSQHQDLFQRVSSSYQVAKVLVFQLQHQSFQRIFRVDFF